jgi:DNA invertase Pin-like site-specific DNA recombinase
MDIGYARVSTKDQRLDLQSDALAAAGCEEIHTDVISGSRADRPGLEKALDRLRSGDRFVVWRLDRLGRSTRNVLAFLDDLDRRGVAFRSLTESMDTSGPLGKAMMTIVAALAEMERDVLIERTQAGLTAARARGRVGGRKALLSPKQDVAIRAAYNSRQMSVPAIAVSFGVSPATLWRSLARTGDSGSQ